MTESTGPTMASPILPTIPPAGAASAEDHTLAHYPIPARPVAGPAAMVYGENARFTVLTSRLIRMEYSPQGIFEDCASQVFWYRDLPVPQFEVTQTAGQIGIVTEHLHLRYQTDPKGFTPQTLSVELCDSGVIWHYGDRDASNLGGTARTLDGANGYVRLSTGLMSRSGWSIVDDSTSFVFGPDDWLAPRTAPDNLDLYFFGYGHAYLECLRDFCLVCGPVPLVPRWALGNWWSRYWEYSQAELEQLMQDFRAYGVPLSVCIIDMDWHVTQTGNASSGWTGYTWNRELFPDPPGLLQWLHEQGLKVALNLHPAEGIHPHETQYPKMARHMGIDPDSREPVAFDIADPRFTNAYFEVLHYPMEAEGIDFWWMDWQQGVKVPHTARPELAGLDPLFWLNHLHFHDLGRDPQKRPFIFSRWPGLGSRYAIGFSGDSVVSWESLAFQPRFTSTASNVAFPWWSHDIGGHMRGVEDPELYTRWVQYGTFSPILRLHSTKNPYHDRRPWGYDAEVLRVTRAAMQLRHSLIPYIYTMAWHCAGEGRPLVMPMYYRHPEDEAAYHCPDQYYYGSELIAAPYVTPRHEETRVSRQPVWLPAGEWYDFFGGQRYTGGGWRTLYGGLEEIPVLAKAGAIVPLGPQRGWGGVDVPDEMTVAVFAGADNDFDLYEDDGASQAYRGGRGASHTWRRPGSPGGWHSASALRRVTLRSFRPSAVITWPCVACPVPARCGYRSTASPIRPYWRTTRRARRCPSTISCSSRQTSCSCRSAHRRRPPRMPACCLIWTTAPRPAASCCALSGWRRASRQRSTWPCPISSPARRRLMQFSSELTDAQLRALEETIA